MAKTRTSTAQRQYTNWYMRRRARITGPTEQMNLRVRSDWKAQLIDLAEADHCRMIEILERGVELYRKAKKPELVTGARVRRLSRGFI